MAIFTDVFEDVTKQGRKIPTSDYHETGVYPIIDQGQSAIAGYTDETDGLFTDVPAIIFGDHTRVLKYVDTPCFLGADGVKLLKAKIANPNYKYLYYVLSNANIPNTGYNRHFKWLKEVDIPFPDAEEQQKVVDTLDKISELITLRKDQLAKLDQLVKSRFIELFGNILCDNNLPLVELKELADIGSSKRIYANEYVEFGVPFYRSKEIRELGTGLKPSVELFIKQERYEEIKAKYGVPKIGDILIAAIGATIGYSWIVDTDKPFYYKDGNLIILSIKNNVNPIFLNHTMGILIEDFKSKGVAGSAQLALTIEKLEKMMVINPSIDLQNQFAAFVEQTDKSKLAIQQSLDKLEFLKKSLMQEYFG